MLFGDPAYSGGCLQQVAVASSSRAMVCGRVGLEDAVIIISRRDRGLEPTV